MDRLVLSDYAWERMAPLIIGRPDQKGSTGRDNRMFVEAVLWIVRTGSPWRDLPEAFGDWNSAFRRFSRWSAKGVWWRIFEAMSDNPDFEYLIIDSTVVRAHQHAAGGSARLRRRQTRKGPQAPHRHRHLRAADRGPGHARQRAGQPRRRAAAQECRQALPRPQARPFDRLRTGFADRAYRGQKLLAAVADPKPWTIEIITRSHRVGHFVPEPRRWVVERTFAWLGRNRRLAKDYEASIASQEAWLNLASVKLLSRQLARS